MANKLYDEASVQAIANAIRSKNKTETKYKISQMAQAIEDIPAVIKRVTGNPIEFEDGADAPLVKCVTQITGSQEMHGYDMPWVGGAGKNKCIQTVSGIKTRNSSLTWIGDSATLNGVTFTILSDNAGNVIGYNVNGTASAQCIFSCDDDTYVASESVIVNGCPQDASGCSIDVWRSGSIIGQDTGSGTTVSAGRCASSITVASGTTVNNKVFHPMIRLASVTDPTFEPYSNICSIFGLSEVDIDGCGFNLWDEEHRNGYYSNSGIFVPNNSTMCNTNAISVLPNTKYYCKCGSYNISTFYYDKDMNFISSGYHIQNQRFTTPSNCYYMNFSNDYGSGTTYNNDICFNISDDSMNGTYEPYTPNNYTIDLDGTRYGGTLDVVRGKMVVTHKFVDLGSLTWNKGGTNRFYAPISDIKIVASDVVADILCSQYEAKTANQTYYNVDGIAVANYLFVYDSTKASMSAADFETAMSGVECVYELDTPIEVDLTPTAIRTLSGYNYIKSTTGDMTIDYITDAYQNFVDTTTHALSSMRKGGSVSAMDIFLSLDTLEETTSSEPIKTEENNNSETNNSEDNSDNIEETR